MSIFKFCNESNCEHVAEFECTCNDLFCRYHLDDHLVSYPKHAPVLILLPISEEDTSALKTVSKSDFLQLINEELSKRNSAIERLLKKIQQIQEISSARVKSLLKLEQEILPVFKEVSEKRLVPLVSDNSLALSVSNLKQQENLNALSIQRICLLYTSPSPRDS